VSSIIIHQNTKSLLSLPHLLMLGILSSTSQASLAVPQSLCWTWQATPTEKGYLITDAGTGALPNVSYTITTFRVTATSVAGITSSTTFGYGSQATNGFVWNGTDMTQCWRSSGALTNGCNIYPTGGPPQIRWSISPSFLMVWNNVTTYVNVASFTLAQDATGAACAPPAPAVSAPIDFINDKATVFTKDVFVK
jgi:hypothetical protein